MSGAENGQASDGVSKVNGQNGLNVTSKKTSPVRWIVGLTVRLFIWYMLLTPFFRCPSRLSELNESSPSVCKPYLIARSHIEPHVLPYYQTYAEPYVEVARPYVVIVNDKVYSPVAKVAKHGYEKYGAPALDQAQAYGRQQWNAQLAPHLQAAQDKVIGIYTTEVEPHIQRGLSAVQPYYKKTNVVVATAYGDYVLPFYADYVLPFYVSSVPFIGKTYSSGQEILTTTVMPHAQNTWSSIIFFANSSLWPKVTGLYSENVEPQLVRIGQRLASYREGKRVRTVVDEVDNSFSEVSESAKTASAETTQVPQAVSSATKTEVPSQKPTLSAEDKAAQAREKIETDLNAWEQKFAVAAGKGIEDLQERLNNIVESHINSGATSHGESLATALDAVVENELSTVKDRINSLAESLPSEDRPKQEKRAQDELLKTIKGAAMSIRERAHALREWHGSFDKELERRVSAAVDSTLHVLDNVRDLGLQEIGMRWAWMDSVTYKDWAKYHELKAQFEDWRNEIRHAGNQNEKFEQAKVLAHDILEHAMEVAETSAKELSRLKDVGKWKISAREVSENFDTRSDSPPALPKPSDGSEEEETFDDDEVVETDDSPSETPSGHTDSEHSDSTKSSWGVAAAEFVPKLNVYHDELSATKPLGYISSVASSRLSEGLSAASAQFASVQGTASPTSTSDHNPILLDAKRRYYEAIGLAHDHYTAFVSSASDAVYGPAPTPPPTGLYSVLEEARSHYSQASSLASTSLAAVIASASSVAHPSDDVESQGIIEDASSRYNAAISAASASLSAASASASSAVYGTYTGPIESMTSKASENWESLVSKASVQVYGTQEPYAQQVLGRLENQYEAVEGLVSELLYGKEPTFTESVISHLRAIYETPYPASALSSASSYVSDAYESASSAYVTDIPSVEEILDSANQQLHSALDAASVQVYGTPKGQYEQATSAVGAAYESASAHVSEAVYGTKPGYLEVASSAIDGAFSSAGSAIGNAIHPTSTSANGVLASVTSIASEQHEKLESATSRLAAAVETAQSELASLASSASSVASEAVETASPHVEEFVHGDESSFTKDEL